MLFAKLARRKATDLLEQEHRYIESVLAGMSALADDLEAGQPVDTTLLSDISIFLRIFAGRCHHAKEEKRLFPALEAQGVPAGGCPIAVLRHEHEKAAALAAQLVQASQAYTAGSGGADALARTLRELASLYRDHIWKEDYLLLPLANKVLSASEQDALVSQFDRIEAELGPDLHQQMEALADIIGHGVPA